MASGITSPLGIFALVLLIIGVIMAIIGIIFIIARQNQTKEWWIWTLLIGGLVLAIFGGILLAVAMATYEPPKPEVVPNACAAPPMMLTPDHHGHLKATPAPLACPPRVVAYPAPMPAPVQAYQYDTHHNSHNGYNGHYDRYVPSYYPAPAPAPAPMSYPVSAPMPAPMVSRAPPAANYTNVHTVGSDRFDPDPQMVTQRVERSAQRVTATGPYGPNGETVTVAGTFTPAPLEVDRTYDYPNHNVRVVGAV